MAFVPIPRDLTEVKSKIMFNLTTRQLINFVVAGLLSIPIFILTRNLFGNEVSIFLVMLVAAPFMFFAFFEKDGLTGEKYLKKVIEFKYKSSRIRIYKNTNIYETLDDIQRFEQQFLIQKEKELKEDESKKGKKKKENLNVRKVSIWQSILCKENEN